MSRGCSSSEPTPTPLNRQVVRPSYREEKGLKQNACAIKREDTVKSLPQTTSMAEGGRDEETQLKENAGIII